MAPVGDHLCPLTDEARLHSSVEVVGEGVEDAAALHFIRLVHDSFDYLHDLVVAQLVARIAWREREKVNVVLAKNDLILKIVE